MFASSPSVPRRTGPAARLRIGSDRDVPAHTAVLREQLVDWAARVSSGMDAARPGHVWFAVTANPCAGDRPDLELSAAPATEAVHRFDKLLSAALAGARWRRKPNRRAWCVLIGQRGAEGFHWHGAAAVPADLAGKFEAEAPEAWKRGVAHRGSLDLKRLKDAGWWEYASRQAGWDSAGRFAESVPVLVLPLLGNDRRMPFAASSARVFA